jgi:general stress protein 26
MQEPCLLPKRWRQDLIRSPRARAMTNPERSNETDVIWDMATSAGHCTLVSAAAEGMHGRPMSTISDRQAGRFYMLTDRRNHSVEELSKRSDVLLCFSNGSTKFAVVSGNATFNGERTMIERLWNPGAQAFWPEGPGDGNVLAIEVVPKTGEYWDGQPGAVAALKMAVAAATGSRPDLGRHGHVDF